MIDMKQNKPETVEDILSELAEYNAGVRARNAERDEERVKMFEGVVVSGQSDINEVELRGYGDTAKRKRGGGYGY